MIKKDASFGTWLKQRRKTLDLTQDEFAHQVGCAAITIRKIESNTLKPSAQIAERLAQCCHIPDSEREAFVRFARSEETAAHIWVDRAPGSAAIRFEIDRPHNNLTSLPNGLIGREHDVATLLQRLSNEATRLLTLVGSPGVGKTRLALEVASLAIARFRDGVFVVQLSPVHQPDHALLAIAQTIGIKETGMRLIQEELKAYLYDKELLLVLDNLEQVLDVAPAIDLLLQTCFGLKVLATSREGLHLRRERRYVVAPLSLPAANEHTVATLLQIPSVALFIERAQAVNSQFELTPANAADIAAVCVQLDGLPLSIELIAARSLLLSPKAMLKQLSSPLHVLTSRSSDHPQRHRTVRDAIAWSVDLLDPAERDLFTYLGVFPQSYSLTAAETICAELLLTPLMLDSISALVDKSLLVAVADPSGEPRFTMLQVLREYASEMLSHHPQQLAIHQQHAAYYLNLARTIYDQLSTGQQQALFDQLEQETYNLRAAWEWLLAHQQVGDAMLLVVYLSDYWFTRGFSSEGRRWIEQTLVAAEQAATPIGTACWIDTLNAAGFLAYHQSDYHDSIRYFSRSKTLIVPGSDPVVEARVDNNLGLIAQWQGDYPQAEALLLQSLSLWDSAAFNYGVANAKGNLGAFYLEIGELAKAEQWLHDSLALWSQLGMERGISSVALQRSKLALLRGNAELAQQLLTQSLEMAQQVNSKIGIGFASYYQGWMALQTSATAQALSDLRQAYTVSQETANKHLASLASYGLGRLALQQLQLYDAERWFAESVALNQAMNYPLGLALATHGLALLAWQRDDLPGARAQAAAAFALLPQPAQPDLLLKLVETGAALAALGGDLASARQLAEHALVLREQHKIHRFALEQPLWEIVTQTLPPLQPAPLSPAALTRLLR